MKFFVAFFSFLFFYTPGTMAQNIGFRNGAEISVSRVSGWAQIQCRDYYGRPFWRQLNCSGQYISPDAYDYFVDETAPANADRVELVCTQERGKVTNAAGSFDAKRKMSKSRFSLVPVAMFDRPLLDYGKNMVSYNLMSGKEIVSSGEFEVEVRYTGDRRCFTDTLFDGGNNFYCNNPNQACYDYFMRQNWCQ